MIIAIIIMLLACTISTTSALEVSQNDGPLILLYHMRAEFGPSLEDVRGAITGRLVAADPILLCNDFNQTANFSGAIAFIGRGNCSFADKIWRAQRMGAIGAVVGNDNNLVPHLSQMAIPDPPGVAAFITIPSVFVSLTSRQILEALMLPTVIANVTTDSVVVVAINAEGEMDGGDLDFNSTLRLAGWVLLVLPMLWCFLGCFYIGRRRCIQRSNRIARVDRSRNIPIVPYRPLHEPEESKRGATSVIQVAASPSTSALAAVAGAAGNSDITDGESVTVSTSSGTDTISASKSEDDITKLSAPRRSGPAINPSSSNGDLHLVVSDESSQSAAPSPASDSTPRSQVASPNATSALMSPASKKKANDKIPRIHNEACAICLEDFVLEQKIKLLPCNHGFHSECIDPWINHRSDLCPICKTSILAVPQRGRRLCC